MAMYDVRTRLSLRQAVDQFSENLVGRANEAMSEEQIGSLKKWNPRRKREEFILKLAQLNNLLGVASETDSPAVVINWLRYQMGRRETKEAWGDSGLGQQVVEDIEALEASARQVAQTVFGGESPNDVRQAHITLVRRYVGYLKRWFVARGGQE